MDNKKPTAQPAGKHIKSTSAATTSARTTGKHESTTHRTASSAARTAGATRSASARPRTQTAGAKTASGAKRPASSAKTPARKKAAAKQKTNLVPILALAAVLVLAVGFGVWKAASSPSTVPADNSTPAPNVAVSSVTPVPSASAPSHLDEDAQLAQFDEPDDFIDENETFDDEPEFGENETGDPAVLSLFADGEGDDPSQELTVLEVTPTPEPTPAADPTPTPKPVKLDHTYEIEVDKSKQVVTVYTVGENGYYDLIVKQFICSTGHCDKVEDGWYKIGEKSRWKKMGNGSFAQFASRISGPYLFHSACYYEQKNSQLKVRYYENLGINASSGCIRLTAGDAYWIYTNCPKGTPIHVITSGERDEALLEALQPPALINQRYDPTDPETPEKYQYHPETEPTPDPTPVPGVTPAPTPSWTVHPTLKAWGYC